MLKRSLLEIEIDFYAIVQGLVPVASMQVARGFMLPSGWYSLDWVPVGTDDPGLGHEAKIYFSTNRMMLLGNIHKQYTEELQ